MARHRGRPAPANDNRGDNRGDNPELAPSHDAETGCQDGPGDASGTPPEVSTLDFPAQFAVSALRAWVQAFKSGESFDAVTHHGFTRFGLQAAARALDGAMTVLAASASRPIDIRCVNCRYLSPDEAILLDAVAAAQTERHFMATVALRKIMPGTAARIALPHVADLARDLARAGMRLDCDAVSNVDMMTEERATLPARRWLH
ncbi:MAG: hypothetical protein ABUL54_12545 [Dongia sp.]